MNLHQNCGVLKPNIQLAIIAISKFTILDNDCEFTIFDDQFPLYDNNNNNNNKKNNDNDSDPLTLEFTIFFEQITLFNYNDDDENVDNNNNNNSNNKW